MMINILVYMTIMLKWGLKNRNLELETIKNHQSPIPNPQYNKSNN